MTFFSPSWMSLNLSKKVTQLSKKEVTLNHLVFACIYLISFSYMSEGLFWVVFCWCPKYLQTPSCFGSPLGQVSDLSLPHFVKEFSQLEELRLGSLNPNEPWKKLSCLGFIWDEILPSYVGIIMNHYKIYKDPY